MCRVRQWLKDPLSLWVSPPLWGEPDGVGKLTKLLTNKKQKYVRTTKEFSGLCFSLHTGREGVGHPSQDSHCRAHRPCRGIRTERLREMVAMGSAGRTAPR